MIRILRSCVAALLLARTTAAVDCRAPLVSTSSGRSQVCDNAGLHTFPVGGAASDCHGWSAFAGGRLHENSANNIRCSADGRTVFYTQFAGSISCQGTGVAKSFVLGECHQGIPRTLYDTGVDFACCNPDSAACRRGIPSAAVPSFGSADIFLNGESCDTAEGFQVSAGPAPAPASDPAGGSDNGSPPVSNDNNSGGGGGKNTIRFGVYSDPDCTIDFIPGRSESGSLDTSAPSGCYVKSYINNKGELRTNAHDNFHCGDDFVSFTQYPQSSTCSGAGKVIHSKLSTDCAPVQTHMGLTYQKLVGYTERCDARSNEALAPAPVPSSPGGSEAPTGTGGPSAGTTNADDGASSRDEAGETLEGSGRVTFTTYTDSSCTMLPSEGQRSTVELEVGASCNAAPKASISNVRCFADKITYDNFPNQADCSGAPFRNELTVGVCTEFPGPVRTWKLIDPSSYDCVSQAAGASGAEGDAGAQQPGRPTGTGVNNQRHGQDGKQDGQGQRYGQAPGGGQQQFGGRGQGQGNQQGQTQAGTQQRQQQQFGGRGQGQGNQQGHTQAGGQHQRSGTTNQQRPQERKMMLRGRPF